MDRAAYMPVALQWHRDAKRERESDERELVFGAAFLNATAKRTRDEEVARAAAAVAVVAQDAAPEETARGQQ